MVTRTTGYTGFLFFFFLFAYFVGRMFAYLLVEDGDSTVTGEGGSASFLDCRIFSLAAGTDLCLFV